MLVLGLHNFSKGMEWSEARVGSIVRLMKITLKGFILLGNGIGNEGGSFERGNPTTVC